MKVLAARRQTSPLSRPLLLCFVFLSAGILSGCGPNERVDNSGALAKEIRTKKIRRITPAELTSALHSTGQKVAALATRSLEKDTVYKETCKSTSSLKELDAVKGRIGVKVELAFAKDSVSHDLFPQEKELLKAYSYQTSQGAVLSDNLQKVNDSITVYHAPVSPGSPIFRNCKEAAQSPFAIWRIVLNQKDVIKNLDL